MPWDVGTTNRPGARYGLRQVRELSMTICAMYPATQVAPFEMVNCADLGDVLLNPTDIHDSLNRISDFVRPLKSQNIAPMTAGGGHLVTLPILRALSGDGPVGLIQFDGHTDLFDSYFEG